MRHKQHLLAVSLVVLSVATSALAAVAVHDRANWELNRLQEILDGYLNNRAATQIVLHEIMREHLPASVHEIVRTLEAAIHGQLLGVLQDGTSHPPIVEARLEERYPLDVFEFNWLETQALVWDELERRDLTAERALYDSIMGQMGGTRANLTEIVAASNGVHPDTEVIPAIVSTTQARNELTAVLSAEFEKLIAIRIARTRRHTHERAREQAEETHHRARRQIFWAEWPAGRGENHSFLNLPFSFGEVLGDLP